jgi:hypothetical protein
MTDTERQQAHQCMIALMDGWVRLCVERHMTPPDRVFHYNVKMDPERISSIIDNMQSDMLKRFNESVGR